MKALIRSAIAAVVLTGLTGIAAPAAAQHASVEVRIGTPGYHSRPYYRHGYRAHRHNHLHYRRPVVVAPGRYYYRHGVRSHNRHYLRWY
jgi:hypothetical protein